MVPTVTTINNITISDRVFYVTRKDINKKLMRRENYKDLVCYLTKSLII